MSRWTRIVLAVLWGWSAHSAWAQDHSIRNNQVVVNTSGHWSEWNFAAGSIEISPAGEVRPHFVAKKIDATRDIMTQLRRYPPEGKDAKSVTLLDAVEAGANEAGVRNLFDGDEHTYWEPDAARPLQDWWFQVDLGRIVNATRIVLKFVPEAEGDPFLQFAVLTSDGEPAFLSGKGLTFDRVFRTTKGNKNERQIEIELEPTALTGDQDFVGDMVRFVQIAIIASDAGRGAEVSPEQYAVLKEADRGVVDYYKKAAGGEVRVSQATYETVDVSLRGSVRYYRKEHPRLAELEVWTLGENIALGVLERNGTANSSDEGPMSGLIDGKFGPYVNFSNRYVANEDRYAYFDLGAYYWLDTHQFFNYTVRRPFKGYKLQTSDGSKAPNGSLIWTTQTVRNLETEAVRSPVYQINTFPVTKARYLRFTYPSDLLGELSSGIREMFLYGEGYQPEVELTSDLMKLDEVRNLVSIEWDGDVPAGTSIQIQTRTGNQVGEEYHYFDKGGQEVTRGSYDKLGFFQKGRIDTIEVAGGDWSGWSVPYLKSGDPIASPSPRKFLMIRARLLSSDPQAAAALRSLRINFSRPVAQQLQGELEPGTVAALGVSQVFGMYIKPTFVSQDLSFDEILLRLPPDMAFNFEGLRLGTAAQWQAGTPVSLASPEVEVLATRADSLWLRLDRVRRPAEVSLIEVRFSTALFAPGAVLQAWLGNSAVGSWQQVDPGDATEIAQSQGLQLLGLVEDNSIIGDVELSSPVVTPNGDGANDQVSLSFAVHRLSVQRPVTVRVFDLGGRLVRQWQEERAGVTGRYTINWSGDDEDGQRLAPGIYLLQIELDVDAPHNVQHSVVHRTVSVAY
ncbi:MAG: hypothetical protein IT369_22995 [Candidatus Latescibacteria bacterium]|nr:hypothetical protein [Candidatus Latescibacterota bacterium]